MPFKTCSLCNFIWYDLNEMDWIDEQMHYRSCTVVLVGSNTAGRKWINYEIEKSWSKGMGVVGINIHNLKDGGGNQSNYGNNPFNGINVNGLGLSNIIQVHNPPYWDSKDVYNCIANNISSWVDDAVRIRNRY